MWEFDLGFCEDGLEAGEMLVRGFGDSSTCELDCEGVGVVGLVVSWLDTCRWLGAGWVHVYGGFWEVSFR